MGADARPQPAGGDAIRALHVVSSTVFSGIERHVLHLTRELQELGSGVAIACPPAADRLRAEAGAAGISVIPSAGCRSRWWMAAVARALATNPPSVLHVHDGRAAVAGVALSRMTGARLVRTQHFTHPASVERSGWRKRASLAIHRRLNGRLDGYIAVSQSVADAGAGRRETGSAAVIVIPPAIELPGDEVVVRARTARSDLAHPVVVFAGRLEPERCLDILVRAVPGVLAQLPDCRFVLAGSGGAEPDLRRLADRLGVGEAMTWMGWVADTYAVFGNAHLYVNTWPREGFGMAMAEAMALGLPIIAVDAGANTEMVDPGRTGLLVAVNDPDALAAAIVSLLSPLDNATQMGEAARRRAVSLYGAVRTAQETLAFYRGLSAAPVS